MKKALKSLATITALILSFTASAASTFDGLDMSGQNLSGTVFTEGSSFIGTNLSHANLHNITCVKCIFTSADLHGAVADHSDLSGSDLSGANLDGANLSSSNLFRAKFDLARAKGANLSLTNIRYVRFYRADLEHADLSYSYATKAIFFGANLAWSDLSFSNLISNNFGRANLTGAYAAYSRIYRPNLAGSVLDSMNLVMSKTVGFKASEAKSAKGMVTYNTTLGKK